MPVFVTNTRNIVGIRRRQTTPALGSVDTPRGPAEVAPRTYMTRVVLQGLGQDSLLSQPGIMDSIPITYGGAGGVISPEPIMIPQDNNPPQPTDPEAPPIPKGGGASPITTAPGVSPVAPIQIIPPGGTRQILLPASSVPAPTPVNRNPPSLLVATGARATAQVAQNSSIATAVSAASPNAPATLVVPGASAPADSSISSTLDTIKAWLAGSTAIGGTNIPNWIFAAGGGLLALHLFTGKKR